MFVSSQGHPSVPDDLCLKQVVVICRHGDRSVVGCRIAWFLFSLSCCLVTFLCFLGVELWEDEILERLSDDGVG